MRLPVEIHKFAHFEHVDVPHHRPYKEPRATLVELQARHFALKWKLVAEHLPIVAVQSKGALLVEVKALLKLGRHQDLSHSCIVHVLLDVRE